MQYGNMWMLANFELYFKLKKRQQEGHYNLNQSQSSRSSREILKSYALHERLQPGSLGCPLRKGKVVLPMCWAVNSTVGGGAVCEALVGVIKSGRRDINFF